jgi:hypothetical protein
MAQVAGDGAEPGLTGVDGIPCDHQPFALQNLDGFALAVSQFFFRISPDQYDRCGIAVMDFTPLLCFAISGFSVVPSGLISHTLT